MSNRSHELRAATFTALSSAQHAAVMGQIAARIGELYTDEAILQDVKTATNNVYVAASQASRSMLALSKDDIEMAKSAATDAQAAVHAVLTATQHAFLLISIAVEENVSTDVPNIDGLMALWETLRAFKPDPFAVPPADEEEDNH